MPHHPPPPSVPYCTAIRCTHPPTPLLLERDPVHDRGSRTRHEFSLKLYLCTSLWRKLSWLAAGWRGSLRVTPFWNRADESSCLTRRVPSCVFFISSVLRCAGWRRGTRAPLFGKTAGIAATQHRPKRAPVFLLFRQTSAAAGRALLSSAAPMPTQQLPGFGFILTPLPLPDALLRRQLRQSHVRHQRRTVRSRPPLAALFLSDRRCPLRHQNKGAGQAGHQGQRRNFRGGHAKERRGARADGRARVRAARGVYLARLLTRRSPQLRATAGARADPRQRPRGGLAVLPLRFGPEPGVAPRRPLPAAHTPRGCQVPGLHHHVRADGEAGGG